MIRNLMYLTLVTLLVCGRPASGAAQTVNPDLLSCEALNRALSSDIEFANETLLSLETFALPDSYCLVTRDSIANLVRLDLRLIRITLDYMSRLDPPCDATQQNLQSVFRYIEYYTQSYLLQFPTEEDCEVLRSLGFPQIRDWQITVESLETSNDQWSSHDTF